MIFLIPVIVSLILFPFFFFFFFWCGEKNSGALVRQPWAIGGSGSTYIWAWCDANYREGMTRAECEQFVRHGLSLAMSRDGSSGGVIRTVTIDRNGSERKFVPGNALPRFFEGEAQELVIVFWRKWFWKFWKCNLIWFYFFYFSYYFLESSVVDLIVRKNQKQVRNQLCRATHRKKENKIKMSSAGEKLSQLRKLMDAKGVHAYIVPTGVCFSCAFCTKTSWL